MEEALDMHSTDVDQGRAALRTWLRMLACTNLIQSRIRGRLRSRFRTTLPRFDVLAQLDSAERHLGRGLTMSELSRRLMVTNGNLTGLVERLVLDKLVSRIASPDDGRAQVVSLTPKGRRAFARMVPENRAWIEDMFSAVAPEDWDYLYELLGKIKRAVQQSLVEEDV